MKLVDLKCPNCGGETQFDDNKEFGFCQHCGTKIMIQEEVQKVELKNFTNTGNLLILIRQAHSNDEGYELCKKFLELEPNNEEVLSYKAIYTRNSDEAYNIVMQLLKEKNSSEKISSNEMIDLLISKGVFKKFSVEQISRMKNDFINKYNIKKWEEMIVTVLGSDEKFYNFLSHDHYSSIRKRSENRARALSQSRIREEEERKSKKKDADFMIIALILAIFTYVSTDEGFPTFIFILLALAVFFGRKLGEKHGT